MMRNMIYKELRIEIKRISHFKNSEKILVEIKK